MRVFLTGGTGFIGGRVAEQLRARGDEVVALVRSPQKADRLRRLGCELVQGDLSAAAAMRQGMQGCNGVIHCAAVYAVGIPKSAQPAMLRSNIEGTEHALDAAIEAKVPRIVYVSTVNVFGNTHGKVVDETYRRDLRRGFLTTYDEAKYRAHEVAEDRIVQGAPIVIVQPAGVYGPGDHSELGNVMRQVRKGRLPVIPFADMGIGFVHVDDVASGILLALDRGRIGESYVLAGTNATMRDLVQTTARICGRRVPRLAMPTALIKLSAPLGPIVGPLMGYPPNLREVISASDGVTYWASDQKARDELGFAPRSLEQGLRGTLAVG
jgi:nucleoside-diphosphate-sugar epimerase